MKSLIPSFCFRSGKNSQAFKNPFLRRMSQDGGGHEVGLEDMGSVEDLMLSFFPRIHVAILEAAFCDKISILSMIAFPIFPRSRITTVRINIIISQLDVQKPNRSIL